MATPRLSRPPRGAPPRPVALPPCPGGCAAPGPAGTRAPAGGSGPDVQTALDGLRRIVQALRLGRAGQQRIGVSSAQLFALKQIADHPDASVNDIAALTFTHQSSVSAVIQRLVRRQLVAKTASRDDRRRQRLTLTVKGRRLLQRAPVAVQEQLIAAILALPTTDRRVLARALNSIVRRIALPDTAAHPPMFFEGVSPRRKQRKSMPM